MNIIDKLKGLENAYGITILLAVETGDRAMGLNTPKALSTVRFIYKHPVESYLKFTDQFETIEYVDDGIELYGLDLKKAINLITESNRNIYEWLNSNLKYLDDGFTDRIKPIMSQYFSTEDILLNYRTVIRNQFEGFFGDKSTIRECILLEKTFMQIEWILKNHTMAPMDINTLMAVSSMLANEKRELNELLHDLKLGFGHRLHLLENTYDLRVQNEYDGFFSKIDKATIQKQDLTAVDNFFLQEIGIRTKVA